MNNSNLISYLNCLVWYIDIYFINGLKIYFNYLNLSRNLFNNQNENNNSSISLKKLFFSNPNYSPKHKMRLYKNIWHFKNIYKSMVYVGTF